PTHPAFARGGGAALERPPLRALTARASAVGGEEIADQPGPSVALAAPGRRARAARAPRPRADGGRVLRAVAPDVDQAAPHDDRRLSAPPPRRDPALSRPAPAHRDHAGSGTGLHPRPGGPRQPTRQRTRCPAAPVPSH